MTNHLSVLLRTTALAGSIGGFGLSLPAHAQSPPTDLGTLGYSTFANAISADGSVIVGYGDDPSTGVSGAFKYSGTTMTFFGQLPSGGTNSQALAVSADGSVIVGWGYDAATQRRAFTYNGGPLYDLGVLAGGTSSTATGVSANGTVVVGYSSNSGGLDQAVKWNGTAITSLGTLTNATGTKSRAFGVSGDGTVTVGRSDSTAFGAQHAVKWDGTVITDLGTFGGLSSQALAVSADGLVIVGTRIISSGQANAFKYIGSTMTDLGALNVGDYSQAKAVSSNGSVIVGSSGSRAVKWTGLTVTDLGFLAGGTYAEAYGVSGDGSLIVGFGDTLGGHYHAFAWRAGKMIDLPETYADLVRSANNIRNTIALRSSSMALMMDYDCRAFGQHNTCVSFGGRYGDLSASTNEGAGILTLVYRLSPSVRIGAFIDHRVTQSKPAGINYSDDTPSIGAFVAYDDRGNGTGAQGKLTAVYNTGRVSVTRLASSANTEAGSGRSSLTSYAVGAELGWGFKVNEGWVSTPYAGLKHTSSSLGSYAESKTASVEFPISYADYGQRLTTATAGFRLDGRMTERVSLALVAGVERDLRSTMDAYAGTSDMPTLTSFSLSTNANSNRSRMVGSAALSYQIAAHQRVTAGMNVRENAFVTRPTRTAQMTYEMAF